jgi:hypothetical protein
MDIQAFRNGFKGTRSNRYKITMVQPANVAGTVPNYEIYAKSMSFPGSQIGMIPVAYQGRIVKFSGERQFQEWQMQVYDDNIASGGRKFFENWLQSMDKAKEHITNSNNCAASWTIEHLHGAALGGAASSGTGEGSKKMQIFNVWPIGISPIDLSYESADSFAEYSIDIAYDYHQML